MYHNNKLGMYSVSVKASSVKNDFYLGPIDGSEFLLSSEKDVCSKSKNNYSQWEQILFF